MIVLLYQIISNNILFHSYHVDRVSRIRTWDMNRQK